MKRFLLSVCALLIFAIAPASANAEEVIYKNVWADWDNLVVEYGSHEGARVAGKGIDAQFEKYKQAKNNGKESDYPGMVKYALYDWTEAWAQFNWGKDLVISLEDVTDKNLSDGDKAKLELALGKFDSAFQLVESGEHRIVPTKNYTKEAIEKQLESCASAIASYATFTKARLGLGKYND